MVKGRARKVITHMGRAAVGRGKVAFQPVFLEWTFALGLHRKNWGQRESYV
jgi:hypothetical protein